MNPDIIRQKANDAKEKVVLLERIFIGLQLDANRKYKGETREGVLIALSAFENVLPGLSKDILALHKEIPQK